MKVRRIPFVENTEYWVMAITSELMMLIEQRMKDYASNKKLAPMMRRCVTRLGVLPLCCDWYDYLLGVRPDGEVVAIYYDSPNEYQIERDHVRRNMALVIGSRSYPELRELIPARPSDAKDCPECEERGVSLLAAMNPMFKNIICSSGGVGWLSKDYKVGLSI